MRDEYHEYEDRLLVEEHELYPERFRTMNHDPANFYARLNSAIQAEARQFQRENCTPRTTHTMNLKELKTKASAAEFTLIETVEKLVRENVEAETCRKMLDFMVKNPPPSREDRLCGQTGEAWMKNLERHMSA